MLVDFVNDDDAPAAELAEDRRSYRVYQPSQFTVYSKPLARLVFAMALLAVFAVAARARASDEPRSTPEVTTMPEAPEATPSRPWAEMVPESAQQQALALFEQGNTLFETSQHAAALAKYKEALTLWDHPVMLWDFPRLLTTFLDSPDFYLR